MKINPSPGTPMGTGYGNDTASVLNGEKTLAQVSRRLGMPEEALRKANPGLDPNHLGPGQPIELPPAFGNAQRAAQAPPAGGQPAQNVPAGRPRDAKDPRQPRNEVPGPRKPTGATPEASPKKPAAAPMVDDAGARAGEVRVAAARMRFEELPEKLRQTLTKSFAHPDEFWAGLGNTQRQTLATIFNRLDAMGLWKHVARVTGEHEQPEKPVGNLKVAGNSGAISFETYDPKAFTDDLLKSRKFGVDPKIATLFHQGQTSTREYNPTEGSLHISVGPGHHFDAHVDKIGAVDSPDPKTRGAVFHPTRSRDHWAREVLPEMIRKGTAGPSGRGGIPGVFIGAGPDAADVTRSRTPADDKTPGPPKLKEHDILGSVNVVFQRADKEVRIRHPREKDTAMVEPEAMKRAVARGTASASPDELRRKGVKPNDPQYENSADPAALASSIAGHIANATREGRQTAEIKLPPYYHNLSAAERKEIAAAMGRIAKAVAGELGGQARSVTGINIIFGNRSEYIPFAR